MEQVISILIVEDEDIWVHNLSLLLENFGFSVVKAVSTVKDALAAFSACDYDLVLMDINLDSRGGGIELGKVLHKMYKKPFIFVTSGDYHDVKEASVANPSAYLTKPINASSLFVAIQNAINNFSNNTGAPEKVAEENFSFFFVKHGSRYKKIEWKDVVYITSQKNYVSVFNASDKAEYLIRSSLQKTMQHIIPKSIHNQFVQVNRAEVVQLSFVNEITSDEVRTNYRNFPISESGGKELKNMLKGVM
ncbi:hypothetical protein CJD36_004805 [Flavipsychrobacter stenotrophus]|uniref:Response regulatory domain-containing protein n=1 Tax=Flavipsychrobacter stenotrophus TaxID=2077091 RepID=A0A2S7T2J7_9BACT|nr:response regulator transcription factor [Flavipsychrobacter stenotrophus]PQJ13067.1 hypothetical protein CJD36_004805 [Flavipsychrobacter stenotrophus]